MSRAQTSPYDLLFAAVVVPQGPSKLGPYRRAAGTGTMQGGSSPAGNIARNRAGVFRHYSVTYP